MSKKSGAAPQKWIGLILAVVAVIGVGALAYLSKQAVEAQKIDVASETDSKTGDEGSDQAAENDGFEIKPGNPVVATVNGTDIKRNDVIDYIRTLPLQMQQMPLEAIFPAALDQIVNEMIVRQRSEKSDFDKDPVVLAKVEEAKKEIVATVFLKRTVDKKITEARLQKAYDAYVDTLEPVEEARAAHILVDDEKLANDIIQKLEKGEKFEVLAKEFSTDTGSAVRGGDIGYFSKSDVVPEFGDAAFTQEVGKHSFQPVKSDFGYHIILLKDKRMRPTPSLDDVRTMLEGKVRQQALKELFEVWRKDTPVTLLDINGESLEAEK